jgi:cathepsin A (carboxypeptidase C)
MTGGPGCSSELALFAENGPCKVNDDGATTTKNPYSWNSNANLVYSRWCGALVSVYLCSLHSVARKSHDQYTTLHTAVDQPAGTGFSYSDSDGYDNNEAEVSEDMYQFLQHFFKAHPEWNNSEFYLFGESCR